MIISVKHDLKDYRKGLKRIEKWQLPKAIRPALNRAGNSARGAGVKATSKLMGLAQKRVKKGVTFVKAKGRELTALIVARGGRLNLAAFMVRGETRQKARVRGGVRAKIGGRFITFDGTFLAFNNRVVFERRSKNRKDIVGRTGPSIPETFDEAEVQGVIREKFLQRWAVEFARSFRRHVKG